MAELYGLGRDVPQLDHVRGTRMKQLETSIGPSSKNQYWPLLHSKNQLYFVFWVFFFIIQGFSGKLIIVYDYGGNPWTRHLPTNHKEAIHLTLHLIFFF